MALAVDAPDGPDVAPRRLHPRGRLRHEHARGRLRRRRVTSSSCARSGATRSTNFSGAYEETFACLGDLGAADCAPAQPLAAARRFLTGAAQPGWEGFLRPDAYLMIVVVTAQDDASGQPAGADAGRGDRRGIKAVKPDPSQIIVSIIGPGGDCAAGEPPGPRLAEFVNQFGANGLYPRPLQRPVLGLRWTGSPAINSSSLTALHPTNVRDTDLEAPGLQADCTFEDGAKTRRLRARPRFPELRRERAAVLANDARDGYCGGG